MKKILHIPHTVIILHFAILATSCTDSGARADKPREVAERYLESWQNEKFDAMSKLFDPEYLKSKQQETLSYFAILSRTDIGNETIKSMLGEGITLDDAKKMEPTELFSRSMAASATDDMKMNIKSWKLTELDVTETYANYRAQITVEFEDSDTSLAVSEPKELIQSIKIGIKKIGQEWRIVDLGK